MGTVWEDLVVTAEDAGSPRRIERDEDALLAPPHPGPMKLWRDHAPLTVVHFPQEYRAQPFAPPRGVYESGALRVEWQTMDNRQPFYHRNCDVDEIGFQIAGERTLMTEWGVLEHSPGDFVRLPRGLAHDNYGRKDSHLLFYTPASVAEEREPERTSAPVMPPFPGWEAGAVNEAVTSCLGAGGHDTAVFPIDERAVLDQVHREKDRLHVLRPADGYGTTPLYRSPGFRLAVVRLAATDPAERAVYRRNLDTDEVQYQVSGTRTLITQRGVADLGPGDFVRIPLGVAYTSVASGDTEHIRVLSSTELPQVAETARHADPATPDRVAAARRA
ncbi:hypothetical protein [Actinomadura atramentaria]|uniref:hypothetical protein n=1 Tax=Actinomadura atramentaria TaxID=1990 RepID=UPI0003631AAC|nr:hypothetical protein [Actinomadura atramentaria]